MKTCFTALVVVGTLLSACGPIPTQPTATSTLESPSATPAPPTGTATPPPPLEPTPTRTPEEAQPQTLPPDQEELIDEWRTPIQNAIILSSACEWMFETHSNFQQGDIDFEEAKEELGLEADFIRFARWFTVESYINETVAEFMWRLEVDMRSLIELIDTTQDDMIGSSEVLDALFPICGSLFDLQTEIVFTAMQAGLTEESVDEIDLSDSEMYTDFYDSIMEGD